MSDQNVFDSNNPQATPAQEPTPNQDNVFADQLAAIKNEEGQPKYNSVEEALKGAAHGQEYISQLKQQLSTLQQEKESLTQELGKRESVEEVVQRLTASKDEEPKETPPTPSLDEQTVEQLVTTLLDKRSAASKAEDNFNTVQSKLIEKFGSASDASSAIQAKAKELGMATEDLGNLAKEKPSLVLELFKTSEKQSTPNPTSGGHKTTNDFVPKEEGLQSPEKSLLVGATAKEQREYMRKVKEDVYKRLGVTSS